MNGWKSSVNVDHLIFYIVELICVRQRLVRSYTERHVSATTKAGIGGKLAIQNNLK